MRYTWKARVLPGKLEEYKKRHDEIWPEMTEVLNQAGIHNYTIWNLRDELFGYYECEDLDFALRYQAESPVVASVSKRVYVPEIQHLSDGGGAV